MTAAASLRAEAVCLHCATVFSTDNPWREQFCSSECRAERRRWIDRQRFREASPVRVLQNRARNRRWAEAHRGCRAVNPWLHGAPPYADHLPGVSMSIALDPHPRWPVALRNTRALHGALTSILGEPHMRRFPLFSLRPWQSGWSVHWWHPRGVDLAGKGIDGVLYDRATRFTFGPAVKLRAPKVAKRGHQRVRLDTVTPVVIHSDGGANPVTCPTAENLVHSIAGEKLTRFDLEYLRTEDRVRVTLLDRKTQPEHVPLGDKYGTVHAWSGSLVLDVNAPARWLLEASARVGLGARTAFGFGWTRITEVP